MVTKGNTRLEIIQGDTYTLTLSLQNVVLDLIDTIYFSSEGLNLVKPFERVNDKFVLELTCDETNKFNRTVCCYDITVLFADGKVKTIEYRGKLEILTKVNKIDE